MCIFPIKYQYYSIIVFSGDTFIVITVKTINYFLCIKCVDISQVRINICVLSTAILDIHSHYCLIQVMKMSLKQISDRMCQNILLLSTDKAGDKEEVSSQSHYTSTLKTT